MKPFAHPAEAATRHGCIFILARQSSMNEAGQMVARPAQSDGWNAREFLGEDAATVKNVVLRDDEP